MLRDMGKKYKDQADIFDVANAAGVSTSTVSRTFNHPDLVRPQTRKPKRLKKPAIFAIEQPKPYMGAEVVQ